MATPRYHGPSTFLRWLRFADRNASLRLAARQGNTGRFAKYRSIWEIWYSERGRLAHIVEG